jgi:hypothetical protein
MTFPQNQMAPPISILPAKNPATIIPEFVSIPRTGGDPVCNLSRSFWNSAEKAGQIQLVRIRLPGRQLGRVLLPVPQAIAMIHRLNKASTEAAS